LLSRKKISTTRAQEEHEEDQEWLLTYSDMITLLLAFFAMLIAVSYVDLNLWEQMKQGLRVQEKQQGLVDITLDRDGIKLFFNSSSFYGSGDAELLPTGEAIIDKVTQAMNALDFYKFNVDVEGHTDNVPISTPIFPSNWELSVARASGVVKYFIEEGIEGERLKASGYAETKPVVPHIDDQGRDIVENRPLNRRIVVRIYYQLSGL
jgi:chemotaxis protein MotB